MSLHRVALGCGMMLAFVSPALAHHSFAMFARDKEVPLQGVVKEFKWTAPHSWVRVDVAGASGGVQEWALETAAPNVLARRGWTRSSLKPGDRVTLKIHPLRDGGPGGQLVSVTMADGKVLGE